EAMLSKIHGFELCDRITKHPVRKVPVFIMTGVYKDRVYRTEALRTYGALEYFEKPLDMLKFLASIHAVLTVPDIKPGPEAEPTNGQEPAPAVKPRAEEPRWREAPAEARAESAGPKAGREARPSSGGGGLGFETVLNVQIAKETPAKAKTVPEPKSRLDDELHLESLLKDIAAAAQDHHRPEPAKPAPAVAMAPKAKEIEKPREHAAKEAGAADIDRLLKTTLADFGLEADKKKPVRPVAAPPPAPAPEKPKPAAPVFPTAQPKPKPVAPPPPQVPPVVAAQEKPKPAVPPTPTPAVAEKPKPAPPAPQPVPPQAKAKPGAQPVPPAPAPAKSMPAPKSEPAAPAKAEAKAKAKEPARKPEPQKSADARIFKDIYEVEKKKSPLPFIAVGAGLVVVAAVGFFLLRPKHTAGPTVQLPNTQTAQMQSSVPEKTPDTTLPSLSEEKLRTVNPKPKAPAQGVRQTEQLPTAEEAIAPPPVVETSRPSQKPGPERKPEAKPSEPKQTEAKPGEAKAGETQPTNVQTPPQTQAQPPAVTETPASQPSSGGGTDTSASPAKANPGDLVDLAAVDEAPKTIKSPDPVYPAQAARFGKEGSITVNALISETGSVIETGILKGLRDDMGLEKAAMDAVKKWKFQPAKKDGVNVRVWKPIVITFKANRTRTP
ncbi:MAG TPA: TonB family protein, partial [Burkholderiales bacterium]|nr:TonB family protein [Burkholderiales bacterium]